MTKTERVRGWTVAILTFILSAYTTVNAQWSKSTSVDPFEGKRKTVIGNGYGGQFPYNNPYIVFRDNGSYDLEVYIGGAGSTACDSSLAARFSFGDPNDVMVFSGTPSMNDDAMFLNVNDKLSRKHILKLVNKLKAGSIVYVEYVTNCSRHRFKINLRGSTSALNHIFNGKYYKYVKKVEEYEAEALRKKREKEEIYLNMDISFIIDKINNSNIKNKKDLIDQVKYSVESEFLRNKVDFILEEDHYFPEKDYMMLTWVVVDRELDTTRQHFGTRVEMIK